MTTDIPARRPRTGVMLPRDLEASAVLPFARRAEALGFAELWVVEDLGFRGGVAQAAAVLAVTEEIEVGVGVLPAAARNAAFTAMELATLARLFPGRVTPALGHGMPAWMRQVGQWPASPLTTLEAHVTAVRTLLRGGRATVRSPRGGVDLDDVALDPSAVPTAVPPVLTGVRGPRSLALSGRVADGTVLAEPVTPEYARAALAHVAPHREHRLVAYNVAAVDPDPDRAVATARPALEWVGEPDWAPHLAPLPFAEDLAVLRAGCASRQDFTARLPEEWVRRLAVVGTADDARRRLVELADAGVTTSVLLPAGPDPLAALEQLATAL